MAKPAPRLQSRQGARNCGRVRSAASYGITAAGCGAQRRDGNGSIAARTGHFRLPLVRAALGVPDEQSRPGPWKPEAGGSHSPTFPWPHNRIPALPLARTCPPTEMLVWFRHTRRAGPAQRPALSGQRVFFGPRIGLKGCDRETPARWASEWPHVPPRSILQALPFADIKRPPLESSRRRQRPRGFCEGTACGPRELLRPSSLFVPDPRCPAMSTSHRQRHPRGICHVALGPLPLSQTQKQRKKGVGDDGWSPNVGRLARVFIHGGPHPWVDDE